jgi:hypothetical protein
MRTGVLSLEASKRLFGKLNQEGLAVRYELHPSWMGAVKVYRLSDGACIGGYVSVGPDGIIDDEGRPIHNQLGVKA